MRKLHHTICALCFVFAGAILLSIALMAAPSGNCGDAITYTVNGGTLTLTGSGSISDYTPTTIPWQEEASGIHEVILPEGITYIGTDAFLNLSATRIVIPDSVLLISSHALGYTYNEQTYLPIDGFTLVASSGSAAESYAAANGFAFEPVSPPLPAGDCGANVKWELSQEGVLTIFGQGPMTDFAHSSDTPWAAYIDGKDNFRILSVVIQQGVTTVGNNAFSACRRLSSVTLPSSLTAIGNDAFSGCSDLESLTIPGTVTSIGKKAFSSCVNLTTLTIESGVQIIKAEAFSLSGLTTISLPKTVTQIDTKAFYGCASLRTANLPGVTKIGTRAFESCTSLSTVTLQALTTISQSSFESCSSLSNLTLPASLVAIGDRAFYGCSSITSVTLPDSVTHLGSYTFYDATGLTAVTLGNGLTTINEGVFENCASLSKVTLGNAISSIGERAFTGCESLTSLALPKSVRYIADKAIGYYYREDYGTYSKFSAMEIIGYRPSVAQRYAAANAFSFQSLGTIDIDGGSFGENLTWSINTETGVLMISGKGAMLDFAAFEQAPWFLYADYLKAVVIASGVTHVGACSFEDCSSITSITISGSVKSIGDYAFAGTAIENLVLPISVTTIGDGAFEGCAKLRNVSLPDKLDAIGANAFRAPNALTSLYIPDSVTFIGANAVGVTEGNAPVYGFIIRGSAGSFAENYATHNGITFRVDGFVEIHDTKGGATITIMGEDSKDYVFSLNKVSDSLAPSVLLAANEYALLYHLGLQKNGDEFLPNGSIAIRIPIPQGVNSIAARIFAYNESGVFTEIEADVEEGHFVFHYQTLGKFVITNANLNNLVTISVYHLFENGTEASPAEVILATLGANYSVKPVSLDGFQADNKTLSGRVEGNFTLTFTYREIQITTPNTTPPPPVTTPNNPDPHPKKGQVFLIVIEIVLVLALLAAIVALVVLNMKKKREEENEKDAIASAPSKVQDDAYRFADTIVISNEKTQEIDIQSLFADEPEEDILAIEALMKEAADKSQQNQQKK